MQLIGIAGAAGSGKDEIAGYLETQHGFEVLSFAAPLKAGLLAMLGAVGMTLDHFGARGLREEPLPALGKSPRELIQTLGTEWGRGLVGADVWVRVAAARVARLREAGPVLALAFSDVRFPNEQRWIRDFGGQVWLVQRPRRAPVRPHVSEHSIDPHLVDRWILNDADVAQLHRRVDELLASGAPR
jgi:hypothetical protein